MRTRSLLAMLLAWYSYAQAQPTFEKIYNAGGAGRFNLIELSSQNVFTTLSHSATLNVAGTSLLDPTGAVLHTRCYAIDTFLVLQSVRKFSDNEFFFVGGYYKDSCLVSGSQTYPVIGRMDSLGNRTSMHYFTLNGGECSKLAGDLSITTDKSIVTWGRDGRFFALKADSTQAIVWAKHFGNTGGFRFIKELPGGDLLAGINMDTAGAVVARLDSNGNFLWCKSYIRPKGMVHDVLIESDDSYIITGYTDSTTSGLFSQLPDEFQPKLFLMELNGNGDVQWCRGYDSAPNYWHTPKASRIVRTLDGNYVVLATIGYPGYNMFFRSMLMKFDQNADTLWTSSMGYTGYDHFATDLLASSDGGYLISGVVWGDLPGGSLGEPYIFKANSQGQFPCWQRTHSVEVIDLFPTDSSLTLSSIDGAVSHPAFATDTTCTPIVVYDGCTFISGIPPSMGRAHTKLRIRPNPTTGRFTLEVQDPLMAESYYSVYDALGKLLYQRPLPAGATVEEIDLSRYGSGTYVIRLTDPAGTCYERVVVE